MAVTSISAQGLSQDVLAAGQSGQQQALQDLQNSLASGDVNDAQSAFRALLNVLQNSTTASGSSLGSDTQLSSDLTTLGNALTSGDVSTAQSAFATVLDDLKSTASSAQTNEATAASQSLQLVENLLSTLNASTANSSSSELNTYNLDSSIFESVYGSKSGLNVFA